MKIETSPPPAVLSDADLVDVLNDLVALGQQSERRWHACADRAYSADLKALFERRSAESLAASQELAELVRSHGGVPPRAPAPDRPEANGATPRAGDDAALVERAEAAADEVLERYRAALQRDLPLTVLAVVQRLFEVEQRGHDDIRAVRDRARAPRHPPAGGRDGAR